MLEHSIMAISSGRPLLARVADSLFWMSRYMERVEHLARVLRINTTIMMDVGDLESSVFERQWQSLMQIGAPGQTLGGEGPVSGRVARHLTFDPDNASSIVACIASARENARAIRSEISAEMWEQLNQLYWWVRSEEARVRFDEQPEEFYSAITTGSMLFQGLTDQTLTHNQRWMFVQLAKAMERIDITCRILDARYEALQEAEALLEDSLWNIQWMAVLRMCCSIEAYRRHFPGEFDPLKVAGFIILEDNFPRSVRFNVGRAVAAIHGIGQATSPGSIDPAERVLGKLEATLVYSDLNDIATRGVKPFLKQIQLDIAHAGAMVQQAYFQK
jgi:uncharacterized alpha-E superfamily protein